MSASVLACALVLLASLIILVGLIIGHRPNQEVIATIPLLLIGAGLLAVKLRTLSSVFFVLAVVGSTISMILARRGGRSSR